MASGSLSGGVCFEAPALAYDAYFSVLPPSSVTDAVSGVVTQTSFVFSSGAWNMQQISVFPAGVSSLVYSVPAILPSLPACYVPSEAFADGVNLGWALAGLLVIVVFVMVGKKLFHA